MVTMINHAFAQSQHCLDHQVTWLEMFLLHA